MHADIKNRLYSSAAALVLASLSGSWVSMAQVNGPLPMPHGVTIDEAGNTNTSQQVTIGLNKSAVVNLERPAADIMMSSPSIANVTGKTRRQMIFTGLQIGETNAFIFDERGRQILNLEIRVEPDLTLLSELFLRHLPNGRITAEAIRGSVILTGNVKSAADSAWAQQLATTFLGGGGVQNMLAIDAGDQVMLQVRVIELQRSSTKQFGINVNGFETAGYNAGEGNNFNIGAAISGGNIGFDQIFERWTPTFDRNTGEWLSDELAQQLNLSISALESVGLARTLAEPNLTVISGKSGEFMAGGEFPIISGVSEEGIPTVDFKEFGISLNFSPIVISEGRISLDIQTSVSSISTEGAVLVDGFSVPSLSTKEISSSIELASGQTLMLAGLIDSETRQTVSEIPGLNRIPVLGKLFSSRDFVDSETELVVLVTPILVEPNRPDAFISPADGMRAPDDLDRILLGDLNRHYSPSSAIQNLNNYQAPIGFIDE